MPITYNGVGTHYYGKKERSTRTAPCHSCGRVGALESYLTRLWFVVVFIPVIPLGRKRIIDECPSCRRHMAASADKYEQARQLQTSGSLERYRREGTPEAAIEAHARFLSFHDHDQAADLRGQVLVRFPGDARLRSALAEHMRQVASYDEWARLHAEALALEPDLPEARIGVAAMKMAGGDLDEARRLLDVLEEPGAGRQHDLGPLYQLATNLQAAGRHDEALDLSSILLREAPHLGQRPDFRDLVRRSEKAGRRPGSLLPPRKHSLRGLFRAEGSPYTKGQRNLAKAATALALAAAGLAVSNQYIRTHRLIRVVNASGAPVQIRVDGGPPSTVAGELGEVHVAEGRHRLSVGGAVDETHEIELTSGFFERWTHTPFWALNPGGEAAFDVMTLYYSANPRPAEHSLVVGKPFLSLPHVDYPFEEPPDSLRTERRKGEVEKVAVRRIQGQDSSVAQALAETDRAGALDFVEKRLGRSPDDVSLMNVYLSFTIPAHRARAVAFLKSGLGRRPLSIRWHRAYQSLAEHEGGPAGMAADYDALLAKDPNSAALLYLRGRVEDDDARALDFYRRSTAADPLLPWPFMARGMRALNVGRWEEALAELQKARELNLTDGQLDRPIHTARMALGQAEALVAEYRAKLAASPVDPSTVISLFDALAASGHPEAIEAEKSAWVARLPIEARAGLVPIVGAFALYQADRLDEAISSLIGSPAVGLMIRAQALAAAGRASEVAADPEMAKIDEPWTLAAVSLGLALEGKADEAAAWREKARALLKPQTDDDRKAASLLAADTPPPLDQIDRIFLAPGEKAVTLALLASRFPEMRGEYLREAARFNVLRLPPYLLIQRVIRGEAAAKP
ncbi:hypothetical protein EP7_005325 [Isosphaeraceae bacterium EP7]